MEINNKVGKNMLDIDGARILILLIKHLQSVIPGQPQTYINYKKVHDKLKLSLKGRTYGESLKVQGLSNLADWTTDNNYPGITGLIINETTLMPGEGYYTMFGKDTYDFKWWEEQIRMSKEFNWIQHVPVNSIPFESTIEVQQQIDIDVPDRSEISILRIIRDTNLARKVKIIHNYECQICGNVIFLHAGNRYAEAHHIKPLGKDHNGPDELGNIMCVCPNHHAELDYGVRKINKDEIRTLPNHKLSNEFITYHNTKIFH